MPQIIYTMKDLRKVTPQGKEILKGIWLSFFHGAKIGVLGHNGAGKSTLLRIMAGLDPDFDGEAFVNEGYDVGFLPQEPVLPAGKTVQEVVEEAVVDKKDVLARYDELAANYSEETADEFARLQDRIDSQNLWELDRQLEIAMDALRLPPADQEVSLLSGGEKRRVALCKILLQQPDLLLLD
ncbi:MAG: ATP-binding cassette domain-containing protein, partial [Acidobacteria bacterium]|nr:ATP-binding cassette domain-containing protein [Acidobacteriota bacterium]